MQEQKSTDVVAEFRILHYLCNINQDKARIVVKKTSKEISLIITTYI